MTRLHFAQALTGEGWRRGVSVEIRDGVIASLAADTKPEADVERHAVAVPGMPNLHSHAFQRGMAGLAERPSAPDDNFWSWREVMYRFALQALPEDVEAMAAQLYVEMLESGFTRVGEFHYLHHDRDGQPYANVAEMAERIAAAAAATGIGLTLLPVFYAHATFGGVEPTPEQRRFICDLDGFANLIEASRTALAPLSHARLGVAPHSLRAVTPSELQTVSALLPGPVHLHAAEQTKEVEDCLAWSGQRPVEWLLDHAGVDSRWCLIHATHVTDDERDRLARSGAVAGLCPVTEANLGDGTFPASEYQAAGGAFGIGSDSNIEIGVAAELRQLEYAQRLQRRERNVLAEGYNSTGKTLFDAAFRGGAQALAVSAAGLAPGEPADIVTLDADHPSLIGRAGDSLLDSWIFAAGNAAVDCVWVGGEKLVVAGRHRAHAKVGERYRRAIRRLLA